jgi:hypothetical protein
MRLESTQKTGWLRLQILEAKELAADSMIEGGKSDPYVVVKRNGKQLGKTAVRRNTLDPKWAEESFVFELLPGGKDDDGEGLSLEVYDKDVGSKDDFLGRVTNVDDMDIEEEESESASGASGAGEEDTAVDNGGVWKTLQMKDFGSEKKNKVGNKFVQGQLRFSLESCGDDGLAAQRHAEAVRHAEQAAKAVRQVLSGVRGTLVAFPRRFLHDAEALVSKSTIRKKFQEFSGICN